MKSSDDMKHFLQCLMVWGLERPWSYGGTPNGADGVFWYWRFIWAELMDRKADFYDALAASEKNCNSRAPDAWLLISTDPADYHKIVQFWRAVDHRLGIEYPPGDPLPTSLPDAR